MLLRGEQIYGILSGGVGQQDVFWEDFIGGGANATGVASIPTGTTFCQSWRGVIAGGGGSIQLVGTDVDKNTHGVVQLETVTNAASAVGIIRQPTIIGGGRVIGNSFRARMQWKHRNLSALSNGTDRFTLFIGWIDAGSSAPTNGVYFTYSDNVNAGQWRGVANKAGVTTTVDSAIAVAINTVYILETDWDGLNMRYFVNNTLIGTIAAANLPTVAVTEGASMIRQLGVASRLWRADWYHHNLAWDPGARFS